MKVQCGVVVLGFLCYTSARRTLLHGGPIGVSLCRWICYTTYGCKSFTYLSGSLTCYSDKLTRITEEDVMIYGEVTDAGLLGRGSDKTCLELTRIILSNSKKPICFKMKNKHAWQKEQVKYNFHSKYFKFNQAKKYCKKEGGSLAQFQNGFDEETVKNLNLNHMLKTHCAWIDLTYNKSLGQFIWGDGTPYLDEDRWRPYEPSHGFAALEENCVCISRSLKLNDLSCTSIDPIICQMPM